MYGLNSKISIAKTEECMYNNYNYYTLLILVGLSRLTRIDECRCNGASGNTTACFCLYLYTLIYYMG